MATRGAFLPKIGLAVGVAFEDGAFAAFFVVEDEGDGYAGVVGPFGGGRGGAVAFEVAGELVLLFYVDHFEGLFFLVKEKIEECAVGDDVNGKEIYFKPPDLILFVKVIAPLQKPRLRSIAIPTAIDSHDDGQRKRRGDSCLSRGQAWRAANVSNLISFAPPFIHRQVILGEAMISLLYLQEGIDSGQAAKVYCRPMTGFAMAVWEGHIVREPRAPFRHS